MMRINKALTLGGSRGSWVPARIWLLFNAWFSALVFCVATSATLHVPINKSGWVILFCCCTLTFAVAIKSIGFASDRNSFLRGAAATVVIFGAAVLVLWGSLGRGEFVSVFPDPWSYSAFATYLQNTAPTLRDGSQPLLGFSSILMNTRYGTPGLLALFAGIAGTDTCRPASILALIVLAHFGFGISLLSRSLGARPMFSFAAGLFAVTLGWAPEIFKIGNWDQVLFISLIPFAILRSRLLTFPTSRASGIIALGLCLAAAIYSYPEGSAIAGVIYTPLVVWRVFRGGFFSAKIRRLALALGLAILLSSVYLPTFVPFLLGQISAGTKLLVAQNVLQGLLSANWLPAIYCLGAQLPLNAIYPLPKLELTVALCFLGLTLLAVRAWWRRKDGILLTIPFLLALSLWQASLARYDYGLYKVLTIYWPLMIVAIFVGITQFSALFRGLARSAVVLAFCGLMVGTAIDEADELQRAPWHHERKIQPFLELQKLRTITGDAPIRLETQSWFDQMWAVFFLQGFKVEVPNPLLYLRTPSIDFAHGTMDQSGATFVLTDEKKPGAIWHNDIFRLLNRSEPLEVLAIDSPNEVETVEGEEFVWLDNRFAVLTIRSDADRRAFLMIQDCWPGYSRPEDKNRTLIVQTNGKTFEIPAKGSLKIPLILTKGNNLVRLACEEHATVDKLASGDPRTLLLGLKGFSVMAED
ncbi:MAG: hypothetical protein JO279_10580 [Verrucomicrobia bacterium]|nr:hypothetical protein [Verrucomicrobiota bacterium]